MRDCIFPGVVATQQRLVLCLLVLIGLAGCASKPDSIPLEPAAVPPIGNIDALTKLVQLQQVFERYQGTPYRYGGTSASGFDCSGFIRAAYREALGYHLPRTTDQMLALGQPVSRDQLQPGDLVFFDTIGKDGHAGIFMGDGRFIHASSSMGVTESSLDSGYWRPRYSQARRLP